MAQERGLALWLFFSGFLLAGLPYDLTVIALGFTDICFTDIYSSASWSTIMAVLPWAIGLIRTGPFPSRSRPWAGSRKTESYSFLVGDLYVFNDIALGITTAWNVMKRFLPLLEFVYQLMSLPVDEFTSW